MPKVRNIITDPASIRQAIHDKLIEAIQSVFPIEGRLYRAEVSNLEIRHINLSQNQQREVIMRKVNAHDGVFGTVTVIDKASGKTVHVLERQRLLNIPYYTNRYTVILDGNEYSIVNQMRTKSGVYTRKRGNDEIESSFNLSKGANFKLIMDPDSGVFKVDILNHTLPAYAVLRILGAGVSDMRQALGDELFEKNSQVSEAQQSRAVEVLYKNLVAYRDGDGDKLTPAEKMDAIRQYFAGTRMSGETTAITLGAPHESVSAMTILAAMRRILQVYNNEGDVDERDHLEFQHVLGIEDLFAEVIVKAKETRAKMVQKLNSFKPGADTEKNLKLIFSAASFTKPLEHFITSSTLSRLPSQINPVEFLDSASIITRLGEGAISSERAVPFETREVHYSYMGLLDPIAAPESSKVGIDVHCTIDCMKGDDHEFYKAVRNCRTGQVVHKRAIDLFDKLVGFPDALHLKDKKPSDDVAAVHRGKLVHVRRDQLDYQIPSPHSLCTVTTNSIPLMNANQGNRLLMGDKHIQQALPLEEPEARLVKSTLGDSVGSTLKNIGQWTLPKSPVDGVVHEITEDYIRVKGADGKIHDVDYDNNTPLATKTFLNNTVTVQKGDPVKAGQPLADSNFTRGGELTMGRNLTVAYMPYFGYNHEDGVVLSQSAAKKLTSVHSHKVSMDILSVTVMGKEKYASAFPINFTQEQLALLDEDGVVRKGSVVEEGDPLILAMEDNKSSRVNIVLGMLHKSLIHPYKDKAEVYDLHYPGEVVAVEKTAKLITVVIKVSKEMQLGDKLAGSYGNKGVIAKIVPDDQMPQDEEGRNVDAVFTSAGVISRINPGQILESALGKVAKKTGKPYEIENYSINDYTTFVKNELKKHGVKDKETVFDPTTGKKIPNVFIGVQHCHKLFKTTDTNFAARGIEGGYDQNESPAGAGFTGPKGLGGMEVNALIAHNTRALMRESTTLRSSKNGDFWKAFQAGQVAHFPTEKKNFTKFTAILKQAGINVIRRGDDLVAAPLTDSDILEQSAGEIKSAERLSAKTLMPEEGGLFDPMKTGGLLGDRWTHIDLAEPIVNPIFEDAAKNLLRMSTREFEDACGRHGGAWVKKKLNEIDVDAELKATERLLNSGELARGKMDAEVKHMKYLRALKALDKKAGDAYVLSVVPIIPPCFRTVSITNTGDTRVGDSNELYKDMILLNNEFKEHQKVGISQDILMEHRAALAKRMKELAGIVAPESPTLKSRGVKGALDFISGDNPKSGFFQDRVIYGKMNMSGRSTISPDNTLGIDEVGMPEEMAWSMYKPFIIRELSKIGYSVLQAKDAVEERTDAAKRILLDEMERRPVIINRAPTLWRHGIMAVRPQLRSGSNLLVNSLWESSLNADYDGDAMNVHLPVTDEAIEDAKKIFPSQQLFSDKRKNDLLEAPTNEPIIGLYKVTENVGKPQGGAKVHRYPNVEAAWKDYYAGKLKMTDYVEISA